MRTLYHRVVVMLVVSVLVVTGWGLVQATAHTAIGGNDEVGDEIITDTVLWTLLNEVDVDFTGNGHNHNCAVTASADVANPSVNDVDENRYVFVLTINLPTPPVSFENDGGARNLSLSGAGSDDPTSVAITTTHTFVNIARDLRTIRFFGKKHSSNPASLDATVTDSSMSVVCAQNLAF